LQNRRPDMKRAVPISLDKKKKGKGEMREKRNRAKNEGKNYVVGHGNVKKL